MQGDECISSLVNKPSLICAQTYVGRKTYLLCKKKEMLGGNSTENLHVEKKHTNLSIKCLNVCTSQTYRRSQKQPYNTLILHRPEGSAHSDKKGNLSTVYSHCTIIYISGSVWEER